MKCGAIGCGRDAADGRGYCRPSCQDRMDRRLQRAVELASSWARPDAKLDALGVTEVCRRVLSVLRHGPATTLELHHPQVGGLGAKQRMYDLRGLGFEIASEHINRKVHLFTLVSEPGGSVEETPQPPDDDDPSLVDQRTGQAAASPRPSPVPAAAAPQPLFGCHHVCDYCGHRWNTERPHPSSCPECQRGAHWITSHRTSAAADLHVPLCHAPDSAA